MAKLPGEVESARAWELRDRMRNLIPMFNDPTVSTEEFIKLVGELADEATN